MVTSSEKRVTSAESNGSEGSVVQRSHGLLPTRHASSEQSLVGGGGLGVLMILRRSSEQTLVGGGGLGFIFSERIRFRILRNTDWS
jgi:hypothetical protein